MKKKFETLTVDVTEQDIKKGKQEDACHCPVARATRRAIGKKAARAWEVYVYSQDIEFSKRSQDVSDVTVPASAKVARFVETFDGEGRKAVKPFSFKLRVPAEVLQAAA